MCVATFATIPPAAIAAAVPEAPRWFQLYVLSDRGLSRELVRAAVEHGYEAIVVTSDLPVVGYREREMRAELGVHSGTGDAIKQSQDPFATAPVDFASTVDADLNWADIERLAADSPIPVMVKGVLTPEDAVLAAEHGARGVVVSNHGGRQLDTVLSGADALPAVVDEAGDELDVLVDGGIRRGTDVLKAIALGAQAVLIGRPYLYALSIAGAAGVARVIEILRTELMMAMALTGRRSIAEIDTTVLWDAPKIT